MIPGIDEFQGQKEVVITSVKDIFALTTIIERERCSNSTAMNDGSSKTHCCAELKLYTKIDKGTIRINCFKCYDLCGSERTEKSQTGPRD